MEVAEAACVCDELCRFKKKKMLTNSEFRRFVYKACTGPYSFLKHANS